MIKFSSDLDAKVFLVELGITDHDKLSATNRDYQPTDEELDLFLKKRKELLPGLRSFRKSQTTKSQWRRNRRKMLYGIRRFHKSTDGKRFHRSLGRFLTKTLFNRTTSSNTDRVKAKEESISTTYNDALKSITSLRTHIYIEKDFYMSIAEYVSFLDFADKVLDASISLEQNFLKKDLSPLTEEELDILFRSVEPKRLAQEISEHLTLDVNEIEKSILEFYDSDKPTKSLPEFISDLIQVP